MAARAKLEDLRNFFGCELTSLILSVVIVHLRYLRSMFHPCHGSSGKQGQFSSHEFHTCANFSSS